MQGQVGLPKLRAAGLVIRRRPDLPQHTQVQFGLVGRKFQKSAQRLLQLERSILGEEDGSNTGRLLRGRESQTTGRGMGRAREASRPPNSARGLRSSHRRQTAMLAVEYFPIATAASSPRRLVICGQRRVPAQKAFLCQTQTIVAGSALPAVGGRRTDSMSRSNCAAASYSPGPRPLLLSRKTSRVRGEGG